jgi:hypothetical protein
LVTDPISEDSSDTDNAGIRLEPALLIHEAITPEQLTLALLQLAGDDHDTDAMDHNNALAERMAKVARQAAMDAEDGLGL